MDNHDNKPLSIEEFPELLEEIIEQILSRLPAKSLLKFRCVSKSWRSLIGSKLFIKTHLQNISRDENHDNWRVLYFCDKHGLKKRSLQSYYDEPSVHPSDFDVPKYNHLMTADVFCMGHCNGVLSIVNEARCFFLWNPTLGISVELPKLEEPGLIVKCGFGWEEGSDAYKLFVVLYEEEQAVGKIYNTKTNSWKTVDHGYLHLYDKDSIVGKFTSGKFHWLMKGGLGIETFDLSSEAFGVMDHPFKPKVGVPMGLCEDFKGLLGMAIEDDEDNDWNVSFTNDFNGRLGMLIVKNWNKKWKIWSMEKYGVKESWVENIVSTRNIMPFTNCLFSATNSMTATCCKSVLFYKESLVSSVF